MKLVKPVFFALCALAAAGSALWLYESYAAGFHLKNITYENGYREEWSTPQMDQEEKTRVLQALDQPFDYLGKGNQVYAFLSQDRRYVLKFFKFGHLKPSLIASYLGRTGFFSGYLEHDHRRKVRKLARIFNAYHLSYLSDRSNTGVIYVHLNKSHDLSQIVTVADRLGIKHAINLDDAVFVLQKSGEPLRHTLKNLLDNGDIDEAKIKIRQIFDMYVAEYQIGIFDNDHNLLYNTGFSEGRPFRLDAGKITYDPAYQNPEVYEKDLEKIARKRLSRWVEKYYPKYHQELMDDIDAKLKEIHRDSAAGFCHDFLGRTSADEFKGFTKSRV